MANIIIYTDGDTKSIIKKISKKLDCDSDCIYPVSKKKNEAYMGYDNVFMCFTRRTYYSSSLDDFCEKNEDLFSKCVPMIICHDSKSQEDRSKTVRYISNVVEDFCISEKMTAVACGYSGFEMMTADLSQFDPDMIQFDDISSDIIGHPIILLLDQDVPCYFDMASF